MQGSKLFQLGVLWLSAIGCGHGAGSAVPTPEPAATASVAPAQEAEAAEPASARCATQRCTLKDLADCIASDQTDFFPWTGPWFDSTGAQVKPLPSSYVVAITIGWAKKDFMPELGNMTRHTVAAVERSEGLVGYRFSSSQRCGSASALSVWTDEESLRKFVFGMDHIGAMELGHMALYGFESTHWKQQGSEPLPSFIEAHSRLEVRP